MYIHINSLHKGKFMEPAEKERVIGRVKQNGGFEEMTVEL
ncbi:hypothetical protein N185_12020 [Sinorhizobium sp. GW3]|nr:hypothetical protein N185_12020 [Sinorhizobium sp. GW3]